MTISPPMQDAAPAIANRLNALFEPLNRSDSPGLVVGVARHGVAIYRRAFGMASIEHGVANTISTRMRIGSTSKHFAALAAMLLAEEGRLDLDRAACCYIPELPKQQNGMGDATLRQLMQHTSGLRDSLDVGFVASGLTIKPRGEALAVQCRQRGVNFAPGEKIIYNNGGYQLLSLAIERAADMPFEQFLLERVFIPLGMHATRSTPSDFEIHVGTATLHVLQADGGYRRGIFPSEEVRGEGAIVSTVDDMLAWLGHLRGPRRVGSETTWAQMLAPARLNNGMTTTYGLGLILEKYRGVDVIHHGGTVIGGTCQMLTVPAHELDIIIMANGAPVSVSKMAEEIMEAVLGQHVFPASPQRPVVSAEYLPLIGATYATQSADMVLGFDEVDGKLALVIHNSPPVPAREGDTEGVLQLDFSRTVTGPYSVALENFKNVDKPPIQLRLDDAGYLLTLALLPKPPELTVAASDIVGHYSAADLASTAQIEFNGDTLLLRIASPFGPNVLTMTALSADLFAWKFGGELSALGGTLAVKRREGNVVGLELNTLRTRNMHFIQMEK